MYITRIKVNGYGAGFISWPLPLHRVQHHQKTDMRLSENIQVARYPPLEAILVDVRDHDSDYGNDVLINLDTDIFKSSASQAPSFCCSKNPEHC